MLRAEKTIRIGGEGEEGQDITVYELTIAQMSDALTLLSTVSGSGKGVTDLAAIAAAELGRPEGTAKRLLCQASSLGDEINAIGGVALLDIIDAWVEVNTSFFGRIGEMANKLAVPAAGQTKRSA